MTAIKQPHQIFNDSWALYKKIVDADYMHHQLFTRLTAEVFETFKNEASIRMLDIGCGDADPVIPLIKSLPVTHYTGYDLSDVVLAKCGLNLSNLNVEFKLKQGDMKLIIDQEQGPFDLIYSSYAIHHLLDEDKQFLLKKISSLLRPGGLFIYIDIVREDGQLLEQYRAGYVDYIDQWSGISNVEKSAVIDHINQFDFPASFGDQKKWILDTSMNELKSVFGDKRHLFMALKKA